MPDSDLYQLEVKLGLVRFAFPPRAGWRVTVHVDPSEEGKGGNQSRGKATRARKALAELRRLGVTIDTHKHFGPVDVVAEGERGVLKLVEVEGKSSRQREQALYSSLGQLLLSMKIWSDEVAYGIAVPDTREWTLQVQKIPLDITRRLQLWRYFVSANSLSTIEPGIGIPDWGRGRV